MKADEFNLADGFVPAADAAEALGIDVTAVYKGIEAGRIPGKYVPGLGRYGRWLVDAVALLAKLDPSTAVQIRERVQGLADRVTHAKRGRNVARG
jgi:hypothetical protein